MGQRSFGNHANPSAIGRAGAGQRQKFASITDRGPQRRSGRMIGVPNLANNKVPFLLRLGNLNRTKIANCDTGNSTSSNNSR
jgi:hypothetical protein